ncbi:MAG TPA: hypothetical protein VE988_06710 [Gemmataceae bacterium]|nr:hypothetical protein [Gemmataceae bacterium]
MKLHVIGRYCSVVAAVAVGCAGLMIFPGGSWAQNKGAEKPRPQPVKKVYVIPEGPWAKVLDWLREETELPFIGRNMPTGNFRYPTIYEPPYRGGATLNDVIDILNEALLDQKLMIIRREASIMLWPVDEPLPLELVRHVTLEDLPKLAKTEFVRINLQLKFLDAEKAAPWVKRLLGPFGQVIPLEEANQLILIDSVENLRRVSRRVLDAEVGGLPAYAQFDSWKAALDWLSKRTKLPITGNVLPMTPIVIPLGKVDALETTADMIDLLNEALVEHQLLIIRGERGIHVVWTAERIEPALAVPARWAELGERGKTEVVSIHVASKTMTEAELMAQIKPILSLLGSVSKVNDFEVAVVDGAGNLQTVLEALRKLNVKTTK